jgi:hypothetical protein
MVSTMPLPEPHERHGMTSSNSGSRDLRVEVEFRVTAAEAGRWRSLRAEGSETLRRN